jgi:hypothetical protein
MCADERRGRLALEGPLATVGEGLALGEVLSLEFDVRAPLHVIAGYLSMITPPAELAGLAPGALAAVHQVERLVEGAVDLARGRAGLVVRAPIEPAGFWQQVQQECAGLVEFWHPGVCCVLPSTGRRRWPGVTRPPCGGRCSTWDRKRAVLVGAGPGGGSLWPVPPRLGYRGDQRRTGGAGRRAASTAGDRRLRRGRLDGADEVSQAGRRSFGLRQAWAVARATAGAGRGGRPDAAGDSIGCVTVGVGESMRRETIVSLFCWPLGVWSREVWSRGTVGTMGRPAVLVCTDRAIVLTILGEICETWGERPAGTTPSYCDTIHKVMRRVLSRGVGVGVGVVPLFVGFKNPGTNRGKNRVTDGRHSVSMGIGPGRGGRWIID